MILFHPMMMQQVAAGYSSEVNIFGSTTTGITGYYTGELGMRFSSSVSGAVKGIRVLTDRGDKGNISARLWTNAGILLGSLTISTNGTGWYSNNFATPLEISANTLYVVSYSNTGNMPVISNLFTNDPLISGVLTAPKSVYGAVNGPYGSTQGVFPTEVWQETWYGVDVIFIY